MMMGYIMLRVIKGGYYCFQISWNLLAVQCETGARCGLGSKKKEGGKMIKQIIVGACGIEGRRGKNGGKRVCIKIQISSSRPILFRVGNTNRITYETGSKLREPHHYSG
jgi:hypothetical protein